jgi:hypothetical protein
VGYFGPVDARAERMARNEMLFRDLNEQVEFVANRLDSDPHTFEFFCECADVDCTLRLPMALAVYEEARSDPTLFVVAPGHERREIEEVLRQTDGYQVVRKKGRQRTSPQRKTRAADSRRAFRHCPGPVYGASVSQDEAQAALLRAYVACNLLQEALPQLPKETA